MANISQQDDLIASLTELGQRGSLVRPEDDTVARILDEQQRRIGVLSEVVRKLVEHVRRGPVWEGVSGNETYEYALDTSDALSAAIPAEYDFVFDHGLGRVLNRWIVINRFGGGTAPQSFGTPRARLITENSTTFRVDIDAINSGARFVILMWSGSFIPSGGLVVGGETAGAVAASGGSDPSWDYVGPELPLFTEQYLNGAEVATGLIQLQSGSDLELQASPA